MHRFRLLLPLLLTLPLAGCYASQQKQLASCEASAAAAFPKPAPGQPFKAIQACMDSAGYTFIGWRDGVVCDMGAVIQGRHSSTGTDAICFEPKNWLELKFYRLLEVPEKAQSTAS
jgi:hypothetical protein